jgi:hypothetical protein
VQYIKEGEPVDATGRSYLVEGQANFETTQLPLAKEIYERFFPRKERKNKPDHFFTAKKNFLTKPSGFTKIINYMYCQLDG